MAQLKNKFLAGIQFDTDEQGRLKIYSDEQMQQFQSEREAVKKYEDTIRLKQQIQSETEAVILESQKEIKKKSGMLMQIGGGIQTYSNPRNWAKGVVAFGGMLVEDFTTPFISGSKSIGEQNAATNLYTQSKDLADQASKIVKTDRPQAEALLRQSQALIEEANKFSQGEATKKIMGADDKLTGKEIFAKSALAGITAGSFAPIGSVAKGSFTLAKTVPPAVQGTKTVTVGNTITRALGLGDIYQVTKTGLQQGLKQEVQQTIVGQAVKSTFQAPVTAGLIEMADDDVNNYWGSFTTTAAGAFALTLSFGYAGRVFGSAINEGVSGVTQQLNKKGAEVVTDLTGAIPVPKEQAQIGTAEKLMLPEATQATTTIGGQQVGLPTSPYSKLGAFNPETDIPMVDLTETIKPNNIDFNPDSVISINATRKAVDDLALLNGNEVGGKKLKINTDDPKFKEIYNNQIKPLIDRINAVDEVAKVEVGDISVAKKEKQSTEYKFKYNASNEQKELLSQYLNEKAKILFGEEDIQLEKVKKEIAKKYFDTNPPSVVENKFKTFEEWYKNINTHIFTNDIDERWNIYRGKRYDTFNELERAKESRYKEIVEKENPEDVEELINAYLDISRDVRRLEKPDPYNVGPSLSPKEIAFVKKIDKEVYEGNTLSELLSKEVGKKIESDKDLEKLSKKLGKEKVQELVDRFSKENSDKINNAWQKFYKKNYKTSVDEVAPTQPAVQKIPAEEVELEVSKIYSELENAGINITPEKVRHTPNIDKIDEKQAKGEQFTPEEFDKGMKEYVNSTGKTEVIDGVQEELTGPMKKSAYVERLNRENPGLNLTSVEYQSAVVKDLKAVADDLIENNFDEAARIAKNINANSNLQEIKTAELYINKLIELGKKDELAQVYHTFSRNATSMGQKNGILQEKKMGTPQYAIKQAQDSRTNKLKPKIDKEVAKVKQQMLSIAVDQTFMSDILDNITCR